MRISSCSTRIPAYGLVLRKSYVYNIAGRVANCVDPDQTPRSAASDQGLHCLLRHICPSFRIIAVFVNFTPDVCLL